MYARKWWIWLLVAALVAAVPALATAEEAQEKSWDIEGKVLYNIGVDNGSNMIVSKTADNPNPDFGYARLNGANGEWPDYMVGTWAIKRLNGDEIELDITHGSGPDTYFTLLEGEADQTASFRITYTSSDLQNPVSKIIWVEVVDGDSGRYVDDYEYDVTEFNIKAGKRLHVDAGKTLPAGAELLRPISIAFDDSALWELYEQGHVDFWHDSETGEFEIVICEPGVYELTAYVDFTNSPEKVIPLTFNVTGKAAPDELPEFELMTDRTERTRLYCEPEEGAEYYINTYWLNENWFWSEATDDEMEWTVEQTRGEELDLLLGPWNNNCECSLFARDALPIGEYEFVVTCKNVSRDEQDSSTFKLTVREQVEVLPEQIFYTAIGDSVTIEVGEKLAFGAPSLYPTNSELPEYYNFGLWIEEIDGELWDKMLLVEDSEDGRHELMGIEPGTYTVYTYLNMMGDSRECGRLFTLTVVPATSRLVTDITLSHQGTDEDPLLIPYNVPFTIKATALPKKAANKKLTWTSDYPEAISVSDKGVVTGTEMYAQTAIYVSTTDGSAITKTIVVRVVPVVPTKVELNKKKLKMNAGEYTQLTAKFKPNTVSEEFKQLRWMSDNTEVAEVDMYDGTIMAVKPGKATIYAYAYDEYWQPGSVFAKCVVTVKGGKAQGIALTQDEITVKAGDSITISDYVEISPDDAEYTLTYNSSAAKVVKVSKKGVATALKAGTASITIKVKGTKLSASLLVTVE
ncbi:MAG: Ig-like domain-containing protein [Clostridia bacterium]|nr:Ig-like domain-containing protein [Clostridia bacterium]